MNREKAEAEHRKRIRAYEREIKRIYTSLVDEAAKIGTSVKNFDKSKPFRFDNYPQTRKRIEKLFDDYRTEVLATISGGIDNEFTKQNEFFLSVLRGYFSVPDNYYSPVNKKAVEAFIERKNNGMNLSQRVWKYSGQFKEELEMSIDLGLREGRSAQQMSRDIRKYLNNPDKLFRRVRDEHGNLQLSKNAKAFHPGAGVYRSSYKNAVRLTGTETNIAYRTADYDSIQTEDFVLGIRIELSNNHTTNGKPLTDICDELKGVYPKDFKFTGWHPNCRCKVITINASIDEVIDHIKNGTPYKGYITDTPPNFKKWVAENREKLQTTNSLPYFVRDNEKYFPQMTITPKAMAGVKEAQNFNRDIMNISDIEELIKKATTQRENKLYVSFEPFSPVIIEAINKVRDIKAKNAIYESIMTDNRATLLNETNGHFTKLFPNNRGINKPTWKDTKQMAYDLNKKNIDVVFLPELNGTTSADALIKIGKTYRISDFKYAITTKSNTLSKDLENGFKQANLIVLKLKNMDSGQLRDTFDYLIRNDIRFGDIILQNKYGDTLQLTERDIRRGLYRKKIKGFLK